MNLMSVNILVTLWLESCIFKVKSPPNQPLQLTADLRFYQCFLVFGGFWLVERLRQISAATELCSLGGMNTRQD